MRSFYCRPDGHSVSHEGKMGNIGLGIKVAITGELDQRTDRLMSAAAYEAFRGILRELHEHTRPGRFSNPDAIGIRAGEVALMVKIRTNSKARLPRLIHLVNVKFEPVVTLIEDGPDAFLADHAAKECWACGQTIQQPDDQGYALIVSKLAQDPPSEENALASILERPVPMGELRWLSGQPKRVREIFV